MASHKGHYDVVQTLLGAGAGVNIARSNVSDVFKLWRDVYELMRVWSCMYSIGQNKHFVLRWLHYAVRSIKTIQKLFLRRSRPLAPSCVNSVTI